MSKKTKVSDLRQLPDRDLAQREKKLADLIAMNAFNRQVSPSSSNASSIRDLKKERARILTIQRERQLSLDGSKSNVLEDARRIIGAGMRSRSQLRRPPIVTAKLVGSEYPLVVGKKYTIVLQRDAKGVERIQMDLFQYRRPPSSATKVRKRKLSGNIDMDVTFHATHLTIDPTSAMHRMQQRSSLSVQITPQEPGDNRLDIFLTASMSKQLLQVLHVPLEIIAK